MTSNQIVSQGGYASPWSLAGGSRAVARLARGTEMQVAQVGAIGQVEVARLEAIDAVAARGLQGVALVSQMEQQLAAQNPYAAARLQAIGDTHAFTVASDKAPPTTPVIIAHCAKAIPFGSPARQSMIAGATMRMARTTRIRPMT